MASSSIRENMKRTAQATIDGFTALDYNALRATRTDDFIYQFLPLSLGAPPRNNDEYKLFYDAVFPIYSKFDVYMPRISIIFRSLTFTGHREDDHRRHRNAAVCGLWWSRHGKQTRAVVVGVGDDVEFQRDGRESDSY